jgi:radical SAM protein with 4Fe4S-binding SPASM domain
VKSFDPNFDRQKLMYHPERVAEWLEHDTTSGPLYTEMELASFCNCRCIFCGVDYLVNETRDIIDLDLAKKILSELKSLGNKSVMFSGHGEPLLHPQAKQIIEYASGRMSTSVTTNGITLTTDKLGLVDGLEWIRFSINGCDPENYAKVHGVAPEMFERVLANVAGVVQRKRERGLPVAVGTQIVLLPENAPGVVNLARRLKELGVDYFSIKPYSQHPLSRNRREVDYEHLAGLEQQLRPLEEPSFKIIFRAGSMAKAGQRKPYDKCYGTHFLCFVSADGDVWECNVFAGDPRFLIGNAREESLRDIWHGPRRKRVLDFIHPQMDIGSCRDICRMDECNRYLWRLRHPWPHDDFI